MQTRNEHHGAPIGIDRLGRRLNPVAAFAGVCALIFGAMLCFYLPLSAVPALVGKRNGPLASGLVTGCLMGATLGAEIIGAWAVRRYGRRNVSIFALLALAIPCIGLFCAHLPIVLGASLLRGVGLGLLLVACGGYAASLAPPGRLNRYMGLYGMASGVPALVAIPFGLFLVEKLPAGTIGWLSCLMGVAPMPLATVLATNVLEAPSAGWPPKWVAYRGPSVQMALAAATAGVVFTFLPMILGASSARLAALALLGHGAAAVCARAAAGRYVDRNGSRQVLALGLVAATTALGLLATAQTNSRFVGVVTAGAAFGLIQCATLDETLRRAGADKDAGSASWNFAYDFGLGLGAIAFGWLFEVVDPSASLIAFAAIVGAALVAHACQGGIRNPPR